MCLIFGNILKNALFRNVSKVIKKILDPYQDVIASSPTHNSTLHQVCGNQFSRFLPICVNEPKK